MQVFQKEQSYVLKMASKTSQSTRIQQNQRKVQEFLFAIYGKTRKCATHSRGIILELQEFLLCNKLKRLCDTNGCERLPQKSAKIFHELGKIYRKLSPEKLHLVRSAVLFNAAILRKPKNMKEIEDDLNELCSHVLDLAGAVNHSVNLRSEAKHLQETIIDFRKFVKDKLSSIIWDDSKKTELPVRQQRIDEVESLQQCVHDWYCKLMSQVMNYCVSVKGKLPCQYALVGMGSLARKEITPYSDFEHVILLEEGVQQRQDYGSILEYFRWVSVVFHIVVVNIGETIVASAALPYLNNTENKACNWFYDGITKNGISFDGMFPHASKFPLGRRKRDYLPHRYELIKPVSKMLSLVSSDKVLENMEDHLGDILLSTCFVAGEQKIYRVFAECVENRTKTSSTELVFRKHLIDDIKRFNPIEGLSRTLKEKCWNVKRVVYRSTTLFISSLEKFYQFNEASSFDVIRKLKRCEVIDDNFAADLAYALSIACYLRISLYSECDRQDDLMYSNESNNQFVAQFSQIVGNEAPVFYFQIAMKLQRETCTIVGMSELNYVQWSPEVDRLLACFWLQQFDRARWEAEKLVCHENTTEKSREIAIETLLAIGHFHFEAEKFTRAFFCFQYVYGYMEKIEDQGKSRDLLYCLLHMSDCCKFLGNEEEALKYSEAYLEIFSKTDQTQSFLQEVAKYHENLAYDWQEIRGYGEALQHFNEVIRINEINLDAETTTADEDFSLAKIYKAQGMCYFQLKMYDEAINNFEKLTYKYQMNETKQKISSEETFFDEVASAANMIGSCYYHQEEYNLSLLYYREAIDIRTCVTNDEDEDVNLAMYYHNMGISLIHLENSNDARLFFERSKEIYWNIGESTMAEEIAASTGCIGDCYYQQTNYTESLTFYKKALDLLQNVSAYKNVRDSLATYKCKIGKCLLQLEGYAEAQTFFEKENVLYRGEKENDVEDKLIMNAINIGDCFYKQRNFEEGLLSFKNAILRLKSIEVNDESIIRLALCYNKLGLGSHKLRKYSESKGFYTKASCVCGHSTEKNLVWEMVHSFVGIGDCLYRGEGKVNESLLSYNEALKLLDKVTDLNKADASFATLYLKIGKRLKKLKCYQEAIDCFSQVRIFQQCFDEDKTVASAVIAEAWMGECLHEMKKYEESLACYEEATALANRIPEIKRKHLPIVRGQDKKFLCIESEKHLHVKQTQNYTQVKSSKKEDSNKSNLRKVLGAKKKSFIKVKKASEVLNHSSSRKSQDAVLAKVLQRIGNLFYELKKYDVAKVCFSVENVLQKLNGQEKFKKEIAVSAMGIGNCLYKQKKYKQSLSYYNEAVVLAKALAANQEKPESNILLCFYKMGKALFKVQSYGQAKESFTMFNVLVAKIPTATFVKELANSAIWTGDCIFFAEDSFDTTCLSLYMEAIFLLDQVTVVDKTLACYYQKIGNRLKDLEAYEEAISCFEKSKLICKNIDAKAISEMHVVTEAWLGDCLYALKQYEESYVVFVSALDKAQQLPDIKCMDIKLAFYFSRVGNSLYSLERFSEAEQYFQKAHLIHLRNVDFAVPELAASSAKLLGDCLYKQRNISGSLKYYQEAVELAQKIPKNETIDHNLAIHYTDLGVCMHGMHNYDEAIYYLKKAYLTYTNIGKSSVKHEIALVTNFIGDCRYIEGRLDESIDWYETAVCLGKQGMAFDDWDEVLASSFYKLGVCLFEIGRFGKAQVMFEKAQCIHIKIDKTLTENLVALTENWIGDCSHKLANDRNSLIHYRKAYLLANRDSHNKEANYFLAVCSYNLGKCLFNLKKCKDAKQLFMKFMILTEILDVKSMALDTASAAHWIGHCLYEMEEYGDCLAYYIKALSVAKKIRNIDQLLPKLATYYHDIGSCLYKIENFYESRLAFEKAKLICVNIGTSLMAEEIALAEIWIGDCLSMMKMYEMSLNCYQEAADIAECACTNRKRNEIIALSFHHMGACLYKMNLYANAKNCFLESKNSLEKLGDVSNVGRLANLLTWIGDCYYEHRHYDDCFEYYLRTISISQNALERQDIEAVRMYWENLGACCYRTERYDDAISCFMKAKRMSGKIKKENLEHLFGNSTGWIGVTFCKLGYVELALKYFREGVADDKDAANVKLFVSYIEEYVDRTENSPEIQATLKCFKDPETIFIQNDTDVNKTREHLTVQNCLHKIGYDDASLAYYANAENDEERPHGKTDFAHEALHLSFRNHGHSSTLCETSKDHLKISPIICQATAQNTLNVELAITANWIGKAFCAEGKYASSERYYKIAIDLGMKVTKQEEANVILWRFYQNTGAILYKTRRCEEAKTFFVKANAICANNKIATQVERSSILHMIGRCLFENGEYEKCLFVYGKAVDEQTQSHNSISQRASMALYYHDIAVCLYQMKDYRLSLSYFENSKRIRESFDATSLQLKEVLYASIGVGDCLYMLEEYQQSLKYYEDALAIVLSLLQTGRSPEVIGCIYYKMGACSYRVGLYAEAVSYFKKSEAISGASSPRETHWIHAERLIWLGDCCCKQSNYSEALEYYKRAIYLLRIVKIADIPAEHKPFLRIKIGVCFYRLSLYFSAKPCFETSIRMLKNINKTSTCEYIANANVWIGACYYYLGDMEAALDHYSETVLDQIKTSQDIEKRSNSKLSFQLMEDCFRKMKDFAAAEACYENPKTVFEIMRWCR